MQKKHLKRFNAPQSWPIKRKNITFIAKPTSGPHAIHKCITLNILLKEVLGYCKTTREVKRVLQDGSILVDKKKRNDPKFPVGVMDIIDIPKTKESYMVMLSKNYRFQLIKISTEEAENKICKIIGKKILKKGLMQLNLYDGKNILVKKDEYKVGDSIILNLNGNKIGSLIRFENGATVYITDGNYAGSYGILKEIKGGSKDGTITIKTEKEEIETSRRYAFVVNKNMFEK